MLGGSTEGAVVSAGWSYHRVKNIICIYAYKEVIFYQLPFFFQCEAITSFGTKCENHELQVALIMALCKHSPNLLFDSLSRTHTVSHLMTVVSNSQILLISFLCRRTFSVQLHKRDAFLFKFWPNCNIFL